MKRLNPVASMVTVYVPGSTRSNRYRPVSLVCRTTRTPLLTFTSVTVEFAITALLWQACSVACGLEKGLVSRNLSGSRSNRKGVHMKSRFSPTWEWVIALLLILADRGVG